MVQPASTGDLEELLVKTSRTFALSIPVLPEPTRREVTVAYLLFRIADTLEDATAWTPVRQQAELARFGDVLRSGALDQAARLAESWRAKPPLSHPGYLELLDRMPAVLASFLGMSEAARGLVRHHTLRTVERMSTFVARRVPGRTLDLADLADLQAYCYAVAGIVGEMLTELFLLDRSELAPIAALLRADAPRFGEALQLVNILKDSGTDVREGRRYLPPGVDRGAVFALARGDLQAAGAYVRRLQAGGAPRGLVAFTALPVLLAWGTLDRVERDGPAAKLTRPEVQEIVARLEHALDAREAAVPEGEQPATPRTTGGR